MKGLARALGILPFPPPFSDTDADSPHWVRMLKRELLPTLGTPTIPIWRLLEGRPRRVFFSATAASAGQRSTLSWGYCLYGESCWDLLLGGIFGARRGANEDEEREKDRVKVLVRVEPERDEVRSNRAIQVVWEDEDSLRESGLERAGRLCEKVVLHVSVKSARSFSTPASSTQSLTEQSNLLQSIQIPTPPPSDID